MAKVFGMRQVQYSGGKEEKRQMEGVCRLDQPQLNLKECLMWSTMDAYVDDIVVKSEEEWDHLKDLSKVLKILKEPS